MPKGPSGQKRPADVIGLAVMVAQIATGDVEAVKSSGRRTSGIAGAKDLSAEKRSEIIRKAAKVRWS